MSDELIIGEKPFNSRLIVGTGRYRTMEEMVPVGYNGEVVKKEAFSGLVLKDGDVLEIVRPVGGG
jgi:thiamine biosynthesis protein ThiS